jgi:D-aminoacyl-tRNA deacylase
LKLIVYSEEDPAGINIASHLMEKISFSNASIGPRPALNHGDLHLLRVEGSLVNLTLPAGAEGAEWVLCLSRHRSESGKRCLTAHTPGNLGGSADLGGRPNEVAISNPPLQSSLIRELHRSGAELGLNCQVSVEATHHGPTELLCPVTFVEIGSDEGSWKDELMGEAVARAVSRAILSPMEAGKGALGVGGGHYSEKFTSLIINQNCLMGHIVPKYAMSKGLDSTMFRTCIERTSSGCSSIVVDWKGTPSNFKESLRLLSKSLGIELVRV